MTPIYRSDLDHRQLYKSMPICSLRLKTLVIKYKRHYMKPLNIFTILLSIFLILPTSLVMAGGSFSNIYVFGDSLSDTGNLASIPEFDFFNQPPYDRGLSNGPRAVEVLAESLGLSVAPSLHHLPGQTGTNYSVIAARARARDGEIIDLNSQINAFLLKTNFAAPADALYVISIGGNDIRDARDEKNPIKAFRILQQAVGGIDEAIRTLVDNGARSILVTNASDVGAVPETVALAESTGAKNLVRSATVKTRIFNHKLSRKLVKIERDLNLDLVDFDLFSFYRSVFRNRTALGFTNASEGCFSTLTLTFNPDCENGANFDKFVFFDEFHPTAKTSERIGRALFAVVPQPIASP